MVINDQILTISQYIVLLNEQLKLYKAKIQGEVCDVKVWSSGHVYFTLKDKDDGSVLECVMWRGTYQLYGIELKVGMEIIALGSANIYAPRGKMSFIAESIELVGEGELWRAYERLKLKLTSEGIFSSERKKVVPKFPIKIGVITSKQGAVIHDFMNNLSKHGLQVLFINTRVEGQECLPDLYKAFQTMVRQDVDVIVLMRGGGSIQSLAAFDAEMMVREIANSRVPVIAAIGHHQDVPLCALASDKMVSTPTAAANLICSSWDQGMHNVTNDCQKIILAYTQILNDTQMTVQLKTVSIMDRFNRILSVFDYTSAHMSEYVSKVAGALVRGSESLTRHTQHIISHMGDAIVGMGVELDSVLKNRISRSFIYSLKSIQDEIDSKERLFGVYNPMRQLALGYSLIRNDDGKLVKSTKDVTIGEKLSLTTGDGIISSKVESIEN